MTSGKDIAKYAIEQKSLGKHYGYLCLFPNGVMSDVAFSANIVFNSRALLHFAVLLEKESGVAEDIAKMISSGTYKTYGYLERNKPWFLMEQETVGKSYTRPFVAQARADSCLLNAPPEKIESKTSRNKKKCARVDAWGKIIRVFDSAAEAARYYGIRNGCIYNVVNGKSQTTRVGDVQYRFKYI